MVMVIVILMLLVMVMVIVMVMAVVVMMMMMMVGVFVVELDLAHVVHGERAAQGEENHHRIPGAPAELLDEQAGGEQADGGAVVLEGVDHPGSKTGHFLAPDIHGSGGTDHRVGGVHREGDKDEENAG